MDGLSRASDSIALHGGKKFNPTALHAKMEDECRRRAGWFWIKKVLNKIFQPSFTTKLTGQGTGLGLSLSYDIIAKGHGGKLKVDTEETRGTTFTIILKEIDA